MSSSPTPEATAESTFVCDCAEAARPACAGESFYKEHEGKRYCVLHFPGREKSVAFNKALKRKLDTKHFNFYGIWFPDEVSFNNFNFTTEANFRSVTFIKSIDFRGAHFNKKANFNRAKFYADVYFDHAQFDDNAYFINAEFKANAGFQHSKFNRKADFYFAAFSAAAIFKDTTFSDYLRFSGNENNKVFGDNASLDVQYAKIEKPEHVSFHTLTLRPHWLVNVDARKFEFINVTWDWQPIINEEIEALKSKGVLQPNRLLSIACRHLAVNAEENHRYDEASKFRYWSMYARQQETWSGLAFWWKFRSWLSMQWSRVSKLPILRFFNRNWLYWFYWAASGYGERVFRAFVVLLGVWLLSAWFYTYVGFSRWEPRLTSASDLPAAKRDDVGAPLPLSRAVAYSLSVMTLQKPEPRPATTAAQSLVMLETILGPVQVALLALAIRRKFMR